MRFQEGDQREGGPGPGLFEFGSSPKRCEWNSITSAKWDKKYVRLWSPG